MQREGTSRYFVFSQSYRQHAFLKEEFNYLDVPIVKTMAATDILDCTIECLNSLLCLSLNMAASKGVDGKLWCELLSSDKYRSPKEFKGNKTSHHYWIKVGPFLTVLLFYKGNFT